MECTVERNDHGGRRFSSTAIPEPGTELKASNGERVVFDEVGMAGMWACTRISDGAQLLYFPRDFL